MSDDLEARKKRDLAIVRSHIAQLMEHFESVQVFCSRHISQKDGTVTMQAGDGNWFARYGQVRAWVLNEEKNPMPEDAENDEGETP